MEWNLQPNAKSILDSNDELYEKRSDKPKFFAQEFEVFLKEVVTEVLFKLAKFFPPNEVELQLNAEKITLQSEYGEELDQIPGTIFSKETDLQLSADYYITQEKLEGQQGRKEEDLEIKDYNWILLDEKFVYGEQKVWFQEGEFCPSGQHDEDLIDKRDTLFYFMKQSGYKVKWILFDEQFIYGKQEDLNQERKTQFMKQISYRAEEMQKRDLLFGRVALLRRFIWLRKKPRIRLK